MVYYGAVITLPDDVMDSFVFGILGGGQLGYLLAKAALDFPVRVKILDPNPECTCSVFSGLVVGNFKDESSVLDFAEDCDVVVAEIESVSVAALKKLKAAGKKVIPDPATLEIIQDKGRQRDFFVKAGIPSPRSIHISQKELEKTLVNAHDWEAFFEQHQDLKKLVADGHFVQKARTGGYDGQGVQVIDTRKDLPKKMMMIDSIFEEMVPIAKEISVVGCRDGKARFEAFDPVEMIFMPGANLLDMQLSPAQITRDQRIKALLLAEEIGQALNYEGVYAVELFLTRDGQLLFNEMSPRVHNSGHHTVHAYNVSQYQQLVRIALGMEMMMPQKLVNSVLVNLIAAGDAQGKTVYEGLERIYSLRNIHYTFYNKQTVRPFRKMGHAVILEDDLEVAMSMAATVKKFLTITGDE